MPDDKIDAGVAEDVAEEQRAALLQLIQAEMDDLTPEELARLYAAIAFLELKQDD